MPCVYSYVGVFTMKKEEVSQKIFVYVCSTTTKIKIKLKKHKIKNNKWEQVTQHLLKMLPLYSKRFN